MKDRQPVIGVVPLWDEYRNSIWMIPGYMDGIIKAGGSAMGRVQKQYMDDTGVYGRNYQGRRLARYSSVYR